MEDKKKEVRSSRLSQVFVTVTALLSALTVALFIQTRLQSTHFNQLSETVAKLQTKVNFLESLILNSRRDAKLANLPKSSAQPEKSSGTIKRQPPSKRKANRRRAPKHTTLKNPLKSVGGKVYINKSYRNQILGKDLNRVLRSAKVAPEVFPNGTAGFKFKVIKKTSVFNQIGFRPGDVLLAVNGNALGDPAAAINLFQRLRTLRSFKVDIMRDGRRVTKHFEVE